MTVNVLLTSDTIQGVNFVIMLVIKKFHRPSIIVLPKLNMIKAEWYGMEWINMALSHSKIAIEAPNRNTRYYLKMLHNHT
jgi:hypothetical protein